MKYAAPIGMRATAVRMKKTVIKLVASATWPKKGVAIPPILMARPRVTPEAKPIWLALAQQDNRAVRDEN